MRPIKSLTQIFHLIGSVLTPIPHCPSPAASTARQTANVIATSRPHVMFQTVTLPKKVYWKHRRIPLFRSRPGGGPALPPGEHGRAPARAERHNQVMAPTLSVEVGFVAPHRLEGWGNLELPAKPQSARWTTGESKPPRSRRPVQARFGKGE